MRLIYIQIYGKNTNMEWAYLSPHFDDAVFSCGGLLWEQAQAGESVKIYTICAREPLPGEFSAYAIHHHTRWETGEKAVANRKLEDQQACQQVGSAYHYLPIPDCIYRRQDEDYFRQKPGKGQQEVGKKPQAGQHLYTSQEDIFGPLKPEEYGLVGQLSEALSKILPPRSKLVCPLTLGGHVDHRLTRAAAEALGKTLWYYADFPYVMKLAAQMEELKSSGWRSETFQISPAGLQAWFNAIIAHKSQISTFWPNLETVAYTLESYVGQNEGLALWKSIKN